MHILHTESSNGWGGQEMRILKEAEGMRLRGHQLVLAVVKGGILGSKARALGFVVYDIPFKKKAALFALFKLIWIIYRHDIDLINTHSSGDAWVGGVAARCANKKVIRTRHLSASIRKGLNSKILYRFLADFVVTTSSGIIPMIQEQAQLDRSQLCCIPTGVDPSVLNVTDHQIDCFRQQLVLKKGDFLVGTVCVVRSWKGIQDFLKAADLLKGYPQIQWVVVGGGHLQDYLPLLDEWDLHNTVRFLGHLDNPYPAIAAMDVFALLSTANEGISQATLQAAYLQKPMITTDVGGLPEVCIDKKTGLIVPPHSPIQVANAVLELYTNDLKNRGCGKEAPQNPYSIQEVVLKPLSRAADEDFEEKPMLAKTNAPSDLGKWQDQDKEGKSIPGNLLKEMGKNGRELVLKKFTLQQTLDQMEYVYQRCMKK